MEKIYLCDRCQRVKKGDQMLSGLICIDCYREEAICTSCFSRAYQRVGQNLNEGKLIKICNNKECENYNKTICTSLN